MIEWQPIDTAPKDGTPMLVYGRWQGELHDIDDNPDIYHVCFDCGSYCVVGGEYYGSYVMGPTHWMPLPEPPKLKPRSR